MLLQGKGVSLSSQFRLTYSMILNLLRVEDLKVRGLVCVELKLGVGGILVCIKAVCAATAAAAAAVVFCSPTAHAAKPNAPTHVADFY
jgi:hypothetical protein